MSQIVVTTQQDLEAIISRAVQRAITGLAPVAQDVRSYLSEEEAAHLMGTTASSLRTRRSRGKGPAYVKDGGRVCYRRQDIETYMQARKVKTRES